jgi:asparagine synthase (glutamine-hydrolysing)
MSGICGIYSPHDPSLVDRRILYKMVDAIGHRGKAARKSFVDDKAGVVVGHVFAPAFQRPGEEEVPNWHEDEEYVATVDGAVFNDADFLPAGWRQRYKDRNTGAVIEHLRSRPSQFPEKLDGHFGLAVWDKIEQSLWLARDTFGVKPLYYAHIAGKGLLVFASELKGVLAHPAIDRRLNRDALTAFLTFGYVPAPLSMFEGIYKVFPGEVLKIDARGVMTSRQYSHVPRYAPQAGEFEAFALQLREHLLQTVAKHINGAQRLGVFWSGGIDSTVLLGVLKILGIPERQTFTLGFRVDPTKPRLAEDLYWAGRTAQGLATKHHSIVIDESHNLHVLLPGILRQFDEPMLTPNAYSKFFLSEAAHRNGLNSCVSGLAGEYLAQRLSRKKLQKMHDTIGKDASLEDLLLFYRIKLFPFDEQQLLLVESSENPREVARQIHRRYLQGVEADEVSDLIYGVSMRLEVTHKSITIQDRTSVLNGVEVRHPFLDASLLDFANRIPAPLKGSESEDMAKTLFKRAFKDVLPEEVANRKRVGYPSYYWTRGEIDGLKRRLLSPAALERTGLFRPDAVKRILEADATSTRKSAGKPTWGLLILQAWFELYVNGNEEFFTDPNA